jgi:hypothetical protein
MVGSKKLRGKRLYKKHIAYVNYLGEVKCGKSGTYARSEVKEKWAYVGGR